MGQDGILRRIVNPPAALSRASRQRGESPTLFAACRYVGQDGILRRVGNPPESLVNRPTSAAQVEAVAREVGAPLITGKTPQSERELLYCRFRCNELHCLVLSKVGNFAIDLPDADVLIQISGAFGSRQEEAQRLGRILRPKSDGRAAHFFTLVSRDTREEEFSHHRKLFLTEQGYTYRVVVVGER